MDGTAYSCGISDEMAENEAGVRTGLHVFEMSCLSGTHLDFLGA